MSPVRMATRTMSMGGEILPTEGPVNPDVLRDCVGKLKIHLSRAQQLESSCARFASALCELQTGPEQWRVDPSNSGVSPAEARQMQDILIQLYNDAARIGQIILSHTGTEGAHSLLRDTGNQIRRCCENLGVFIDTRKFGTR